LGSVAGQRAEKTGVSLKMFERSSGIILACDVPTLEELADLVRVGRSCEAVVGYKVGFALALRFGLRRVTDTVKSDDPRPVIYDHQKAGSDIPRMGELFAKTCADGGVDGIIVFPQAGPRTLEAFVKAIIQVGATPIVGGVMTHPSYLAGEGGFIEDSAPARIYRTAAELGVVDFVLPGTKPRLIREYSKVVGEVSGTATVMMPGIGTQGGLIHEAFEAVGTHRPFAIVGSAVYAAPDKAKALDEIASQVTGFGKDAA